MNSWNRKKLRHVRLSRDAMHRRSLRRSVRHGRSSIRSRLLSRNSQLATRNSPPRRGILLLVVLSLLVLFLLLGTAFVISANQYRKASKTLARMSESSETPAREGSLLDEVIGQIVRDTNNPYSALRYHSLLRDMYGNDGFSAEVINAAWAGGAGNPTGGQMIQFEVTNLKDSFGNTLNISDLSQIDNAYNGLVVSFVDGKSRGRSTRVVGYRDISLPGPPIQPFRQFRAMAFPLADGKTIANPNDLNESRIVFNGRPFNGTGVGYNINAASTEPKLNGLERVQLSGGPINFPIALLPNAVFFDPASVDHQNDGSVSWGQITPGYFDPRSDPLHPLHNSATRPTMRAIVGLGSSDESYEAADFQNMFLALMPVNPQESVNPVPGTSLGSMVIPSFHRPALLNHRWKNVLDQVDLTDPDNVGMLRKILFRPNWVDHPNFTGSNPEFASLAVGDTTLKLEQMIFGPWDVDNDNDGVRDSVWVDFGAPIVIGPNGKRMKPLAAILVLDMDGRLNLNAHGTRGLAGEDPGVAVPDFLAGGTSSSNLPHGQGYGPADISLAPVLGAGTAASDRFDELLRGGMINGREWPGRYGERTSEGAAARPGNTTKFDLRAQLKMQGLPRRPDRPSSFVTPPDFLCRRGVGVNDWGQPVFEAMGDAFDLDMNSPYEMNLSEDGTRGENAAGDDALLSLAELERVLRAYDVDAGSLPPRLWELSDRFRNGGTTVDTTLLNQWRTLLTTDSNDLPVPSVQVPKWMLVGPNGSLDPLGPMSDDFADVMSREPVNATFADLLEYRLRLGFNPASPSTPLTAAQQVSLREELSKLLPQDLADGLRIDINRPLGNGRDDNGNDVVDEPGEDEGAYWSIDRPRATDGVAPVNVAADDFENTGTGVMRDDIDRNGDESITDLERGLDTNNDGVVDGSDDPLNFVQRQNFRRQMLARHLYVLALTLVDPYVLTTTDGKAKSRQLAQWAINTVDFRDPDNCMSPFEYDENPFDGWDVDGTIANDGPDRMPGTLDDVVSADDIDTFRGLVWGAERPELVMTETLTWHDRRTTDEGSPEEIANPGETAAYIGMNPNDDQDFDQQMRPRGAAFIELYNPWPANPAVNADTHRIDTAATDPNQIDLGVDLARTHDGTPTGFPVWRMAIYKREPGKASADTVVWDPDDPDTTYQPTTTIDRTVYFTGRDPLYTDDGVAFFNDMGNNPDRATTNLIPPVRPGRYLVVGSGDDFTGTGVYEAHVGDFNTGTQQRQIVMDTRGTRPSPFAFDFADPGGQANVLLQNGVSGNPICDVAVIDQVDDGTGTGMSKRRRFTLTEPANGYPDITAGGTRYHDAYYATGEEGWYGTSATKAALDTPLDDSRADGETRLMLPANTTDQRVVECFSWIYLQRLANPLLPFDKDSNPYLTIDSMSANVTVFNGRNKEEEIVVNGAVETYRNTMARANFASLQRGYGGGNEAAAAGGGAAYRPDCWAYEWASSPPLNNPGRPQKRRGLWEVPRGGRPGATDSHMLNAVPKCSLGYLNEHFRANMGDKTMDLDEQLKPRMPFPWLTWNNRPYVSATELMQVPAYRSSQLLRAFSMKPAGAGIKAGYDGDTVKVFDNLITDGPYRHLANFFRTKKGAAGKEGIVGLHRVLEYLQVPSRFVGTETWLNPAAFGDITIPLTNTADPRYQRQPPFNKISTYREPGQVNLNTMVSQDVYRGLMHGATNPSVTGTIHPGPTWNNLIDSRRGYSSTVPVPNQLALDPNVPTFFANPFRSADSGNLVPLAQMLRTEADCILARSVAGTPGIPGSPVTPPTSGGDPLFGATTVDDPGTPVVFENSYRDTDRNPYFRYQPMTRLDNLTTTRSGVFAVWVTIGFFEVEELNEMDHPTILARFGDGTLADAATNPLFQKVYPDGYTFGKEVGSDTGQIVRPRKFVMVDRTIPVAFEPGRDHNVERAIRLRRRIE